ncbi:MAG: metallophosphoesterase [Deltaproteobacteria bacterium]|nr:metallophosphoesterase [Deltaproteobacteria bacterium]
MSKLIIVHVSDFHFAPKNVGFLNFLSKEDLISKRLIGWLNYQYNRRPYFKDQLKENLIAKLNQIEWDYLIITGDLTNVASEMEFKIAREYLDPLIKKGKVILTAGNHDRYTQSSLKQDWLKKYFPDCYPYRKANLKGQDQNILSLDEETVLLGIDMSAPRNWFSSRGSINGELNQYQEILSNHYKNHFKIVIGHYPAFLPEEIQQRKLHSLENIKLFQEFLMNCGIDLYLHGHIHKTWSFKPVENHTLTSVNSGGCCRHSSGPWAGFHRLTIQEKEATIQRVLPNDL